MAHHRSSATVVAITLLWAAVAIAVSPTTTAPVSSYTPSVDAARQNAFQLFNAVHSAMRQWGSSVNHNGLSFFLATVPAGQVFYHGNHIAVRPEGFEWLAFEIEHAIQFARSWDPQYSPRSFSPHLGFNDSNQSDESGQEPASAATSIETLGSLHGRTNDFLEAASRHERARIDTTVGQKPFGTTNTDNNEDDEENPITMDDSWTPPSFPNVPLRGYLHTYRAARPLNLLYVDGMASAQCQLGTLDSQDLILLGHDESPHDDAYTEFQRVQDMCRLLDSWALDDRRIDGFVRMETAFEIIYCHFEDEEALELVSFSGSPFPNQTSLSMMDFEWIRAAAQRYHGMPAGRIDIDFSSMVTAYAYPINLTNPDQSRPDLPRVINTTKEERLGIRSRIQEVSQERYHRTPESVNWQGVVDRIVSRFAGRLWHFIDTDVSAETLFSDIGILVNLFMDFRDAQPTSTSALNRCIQHYLDPAVLRPDRFTPEDIAIHAAIETVSERICTTLFDVHHILSKSELSEQSTSRQDVVGEVQGIIRALVKKLDWPTWKECGRCQNADEICFVPMFPFGNNEDHFHPRCRNSSLLSASDLMEYFHDFVPWS